MLKQRDRIAAVALMVLAAVIFASTFTFPPPGQPLDPGVGAIPRIVAGVIFLMAFVPLMRPTEGEPLPRGMAAVRVVGTLTLLLGYTLLLDEIGFVITSVLFLVLELLLVGVRRPIPLVALPVLTSFGLFFLFRSVLDVPLPRSGLGGLPF